MKKKNYIFVLTFLCMFVGQMGYGQDDYKGDVDHYDTLIWNGVEYEVNVTVYENGDDFINDHPDLDLSLTDKLTNEQYENFLESGGSECIGKHNMEDVNDQFETDPDHIHTVQDPIWTLTTPDEYVDNGDCTDYRSYAYPCETYIDYGDCSDYRSYAYPCDTDDPCDSNSSAFDSSLCEQLNSGDDGSNNNTLIQGTNPINNPGIDYVPKATDKLVKPNIITTTTTVVQKLPVCVLLSVEITLNNVLALNVTAKEIGTAAVLSTSNIFVARDGLTPQQTKTFITNFCQTESLIKTDFKKAIDNGKTFLTDLLIGEEIKIDDNFPNDSTKDKVTKISHSISVIGYDEMDNFIYIDPTLGKAQVAPSTNMAYSYAFIITGKK